MPLITREVYTSMGLNEGEYNLILKLIGREPSHTELGMFAVMWSEHCGYKYSRPILAVFKQYKAAIEGDGLENAGIVDIGDGFGVTFKVESHNHPSAVEPYQGAATGVGGIIRDILTMGARPIASLNSLRFGTITPGVERGDVCARNQFLLEHVVAGIAGYGNCVGVPTVGGEVGFHPGYSGNPLVNAMCVGLLRLDQVTTAAASGDGNPVLYLGSRTGKDGIHGATFASEELNEESDNKRPNVQIGDPFAEKLLIEATLEALATGAIVAIQDMGAAGLTCSTVETASKGGVGMEIDLDKVPMRESDMTGYELMLSESQERMLAVTHKGRENEVLNVFRKWGLPAEVIGYVKEGGNLVIRRHGFVEANLDPRLLTDHCPTYTTEAKEPEAVSKAKRFDISTIPEAEPRDALFALLDSPEIASKRWIYRQYDQQVQTQTILTPGHSDAAVLAPRRTKKGIAISIDCNSRHVTLDPFVGGVCAVAEAARNVACTGALPRAVTDGLNFGSPENPEVYYQFREAVNGIAEAADLLGTPVVSGNVSFYNRTEAGEIPPTPIIGMIGVLEDASKAVPSYPDNPNGLEMILLDASPSEAQSQGLGASAYLAYVHKVEDGRPTMPDLKKEKALYQLLVSLANDDLMASAHDCSDGGFAVAVAEIAIGAQSGMVLALKARREVRTDALLFGEQPGRVVISCNSAAATKIEERAERLKIGTVRIGRFVPERVVTVMRGSTMMLDADLDLMCELHGSAIESAMGLTADRGDRA